MQLGLSLIWTEAKKRGIALEQVLAWMSSGPAKLAGLERKGQLAPGSDADFAIFSPEEDFVVDVAKLQHRNPVSAYDGKTLDGVVAGTWLRGEKVDFTTPHGQLLRRGES